MFFTSDLLADVKKILQNFEQKKLKIAAAESCTGGLLSGLFTEIPGSSKIFDRGFVVYSNRAKIEMLGVEEKTLEKFGAVSEEVAREMASGAIKNSQADVSVAITGIAGPDGGSLEKPVGLVYIACASRKSSVVSRKFNFSGDRGEVRKFALIAALAMLESATQIQS